MWNKYCVLLLYYQEYLLYFIRKFTFYTCNYTSNFDKFTYKNYILRKHHILIITPICICKNSTIASANNLQIYEKCIIK